MRTQDKIQIATSLTLMLFSACDNSVSVTYPVQSLQSSSTEQTVFKALIPITTPSSTPVPPVLQPCEGRILNVGPGVWNYSAYIAATSPTSADELYLREDCTWNASWSDKTWNGGGTAYTANGTFSFGANDTITFMPSGLRYRIYIRTPGTKPTYIMSLDNPELLYSLRTVQNLANAAVHTGLAFEDWVINTALKNSACNGSQTAWESCMNYRYSLPYSLSGRQSTMYAD